MNERIKQLAEQSQKVVGHTDGGYTEIKALDQEKFAELIVRECIAKAEEEAERYLGFPNLENADMYAKVMYNYQALLKEHFGVEE